MNKRTLLQGFVLMGLAACTALTSAQERDALVLIGNANVPRLDAPTVQRLYTGRTVEVGGTPVVVVNAAPGSRARERFLALVMQQDEEKYVGYWTVRKHIGKGTPPRELKSAADIIEFVQSTPGAVGYVLNADLKTGLNVVFKP